MCTIKQTICIIFIYIYIRTYIHTLHYSTLQYITLHYCTLQYITVHYSTLRYITVHYITLHTLITLHYIALHYITLRYITLHTYIHPSTHPYIHVPYIFFIVYVILYIYISILPLSSPQPTHVGKGKEGINQFLKARSCGHPCACSRVSNTVSSRSKWFLPMRKQVTQMNPN